MLNKFSKTLQFSAELVFIVILCLVTTLLSVITEHTGIIARLTACLLSIYLVFMLYMEERVRPLFGYKTLWIFWIVKGFLLKYAIQSGAVIEYEAYGVSGEISIFYSLVLFSLPCVAMASESISRAVSRHSAPVLLIYFVLLSILPNAGSNLMTESHVVTILRIFLSLGTYAFVVKLHPKLDDNYKYKDGMMTIFYMIFVFESHIIIMILIATINLILVVIFGSSHKRLVAVEAELSGDELV